MHGGGHRYPYYVEILRVISSSYWNNHYTFGKVTEGKKKLLGENAIKTII